MQVEKTEELKYALQVNAEETTFDDKTDDYCRLKLRWFKDIPSKKSRILIQKEKSRRTDLQ